MNAGCNFFLLSLAACSMANTTWMGRRIASCKNVQDYFELSTVMMATFAAFLSFCDLLVKVPHDGEGQQHQAWWAQRSPETRLQIVVER